MTHLSALVVVQMLLMVLHWPGQATAQPSHTSNWAVLVSTSRYWLNYRHSANIMSIYRSVKHLGIPDSNIIMMVADDHACNPRNPFKGAIFSNESHVENVYGDDVEVDYRGYEVTVENFLRVLTGRHDPGVPRTKRLLSDAGSNVLIYMTGHGGDEFIKFQDTTELMAQDLADALAQMSEKQRYNQVLLMVESCEAATLTTRITAPKVIMLASSIKGESSFSYKNDYTLGQPITDRFTHLTLHFAANLSAASKASLQDLADIYTYEMMESHLAYRMTEGFNRPLSRIQVTEFLGSVAATQVLSQAYPLPRRTTGSQMSQVVASAA